MKSRYIFLKFVKEGRPQFFRISTKLVRVLFNKIIAIHEWKKWVIFNDNHMLYSKIFWFDFLSKYH